MISSKNTGSPYDPFAKINEMMEKAKEIVKHAKPFEQDLKENPEDYTKIDFICPITEEQKTLWFDKLSDKIISGTATEKDYEKFRQRFNGRI